MEPLGELIRQNKPVEFELVSAEPNPTYTWAAVRAVAAGARFTAFTELTHQIPSDWQNHLAIKVTSAGQPRMDFPGVRTEQINVENRLSIVASELLHHARAALDLCVHLASWRDSGIPNQYSQFPLAETNRQWRDAMRGRWLEGVSATHKDWIRAVQPFCGVGWTGNLRRLSNEDKHRLTVRIATAYRVTIDDWSVAADPPGSADMGTLNPSKRELRFLIRDALDASANPVVDASASDVLLGVVQGVVALVNQFLVDEGNNEIQLTTSHRHSEDSDG